MAISSLFVLVPHFGVTGPTLGAAALCNALTDRISVSLVSLRKKGGGVRLRVSPKVNLIELKEGHIGANFMVYRRMLRAAGGRAGVVSLSSCFQADIVNSLLTSDAITISSVRGNLPRAYWLEYGIKGAIAAQAHLLALRRFDLVIAMSEDMAVQLKRRRLRRVAIVKNFVDEADLDRYRFLLASADGPFRFAFLGRLSRSKRPDLLITAIAGLNRRGIPCTLDMYGDGPLASQLHAQTRALGVEATVHLHGHEENPYSKLQCADCLALPSLAEGTPRAILEALYFGIPCVARNVDGMNELITPGVNGELFQEDGELEECLVRVARSQWARTCRGSRALLPAAFRQQVNADLMLDIIASR